MILEGQTRFLNPEWIKQFWGISCPRPYTAVSLLLGVTGFCCVWILVYADLTRPLCWLLKEAQQNSQSYLEWDLEGKKTFRTLKQALQSAPALSLPSQDRFQL
jgi:hypothetical protein